MNLNIKGKECFSCFSFVVNFYLSIFVALSTPKLLHEVERWVGRHIIKKDVYYVFVFDLSKLRNF